MKRLFKDRRVWLVTALALLLAAIVPVVYAASWTRIDELLVVRQAYIAGPMTFVSADLDMDANKIDLDADADTSITVDTDDQIDFEIGGSDEMVVTTTTLTLADMVVNQSIGVENVGGLPSIVSASLPYTPTSGALFTVGASEIWFVYAVYCEVTTNFDCTGDDCTLTIGDGNDADGFLVLTDAEMQAADAEFTGAPAGWKGLHTDSMGAYLSGLAPFVYDGTDTIDYAVGGTDPAAGAATCYIVYQRVQ